MTLACWCQHYSAITSMNPDPCSLYPRMANHVKKTFNRKSELQIFCIQRDLSLDIKCPVNCAGYIREKHAEDINKKILQLFFKHSPFKGKMYLNKTCCLALQDPPTSSPHVCPVTSSVHFLCALPGHDAPADQLLVQKVLWFTH